MQIAIMPVTPLQQNCTLIWCENTMEGAFIDPGGEVEGLLQLAQDKNVNVIKILLTHGHIDHVGGVAEMVERLNIPVEGPHKDDKFLLDKVDVHAAKYDMGPGPRPFTPDRWLQDGDSVSFGEIEFMVRHCPGHSPGHIIFFSDAHRFAQVGDVIFRGSIGRTDLPGGNQLDLITSIKTQLLPLGDDISFIPGHGPHSTFGHERQTNPFLVD